MEITNLKHKHSTFESNNNNNNGEPLKKILTTNFQNLEYLISTFDNKQIQIKNETKEIAEKINECEGNVKNLCNNAKEHYQEIKRKMKNFIQKLDNNISSQSQLEVCKLIDETSNFTKFYEFSKTIESELEKLMSLKDFITQNDQKNNLKDEEEKYLSKKRVRSSDGEGDSTKNEEIEKDLHLNLLNDESESSNQNNTNTSIIKNSLEIEPKKKRVKRATVGLGLPEKKEKLSKSKGDKNKLNDSKSKSKLKNINEEKNSKVNNEDTKNNNDEPKKLYGIALFNKQRTERIQKEKEEKERKEKEKAEKKLEKSEKEKVEKSEREKKIKMKIKNPERKKSSSPVINLFNKDNNIKTIQSKTQKVEVHNLESFTSSDESLRFDLEKEKRLNSCITKRKESKTFSKTSKIKTQKKSNSVLHSMEDENEIFEPAPVNFVLKNGPNFEDDDEENFNKTIKLEKNERLNEINVSMIENLTDLCESIGKESITNSINDYLMTNLENCLFTKRLYYSEFDFNSKNKKFNYEYLTKNNNLIEKIENFQNVKLVIVRKGKQNINNLLKSMENFFKMYIKRKDMDGSAMIKGVLNCSFDKLQKYYNTHMRSFDYCEAIQIEVFLFKWDLFNDFNENYDKTNMNKKELSEMSSFSNKLIETRILMKKKEMLLDSSNFNINRF